MMEQKFDIADSEQLVQRFLDQELSAEERMRFVARLGRDEALRQRAIELEQLVLDVSRLPRPAVPDGFVASVMERLEEMPTAAPARPTQGSQSRLSGVSRGLARALWAPRALQWNLASAVAVACLALLVVGGVVAGTLKLTPKPLPSAAGAADAPSSAAAPSTMLVRLVVLQPGARTVQVAGDFNGWNPSRTSLDQISSGAWAVTIPLKPGRYEYMFVVDGRKWIADPFAVEQNNDGFGSRNAVIEVRQGATL